MSAEGIFFHRQCLRCTVCKCTLMLGNYAFDADEEGEGGKFYCKPDYNRMIYRKPKREELSPTKVNQRGKCSFQLFSNLFYNIPRVCLLNRSPIPAMDLKSNRSGLWRHMLETCRRLTRLCRERSNNVARHDKTSIKSTLLSRDMIFMSHRIDVMLWLYTFRSCNTCTFSLPTFAVLRHTT